MSEKKEIEVNAEADVLIAQVQLKLNAMFDHLTYLDGCINTGNLDYAKKCLESVMYYHRKIIAELSVFGTIEGQLCPYVDCAENLGFDKAGYYKCPKCGRFFYARESESEIEDWNCECVEVQSSWLNPRDLGPSWATPSSLDLEA